MPSRHTTPVQTPCACDCVTQHQDIHHAWSCHMAPRHTPCMSSCHMAPRHFGSALRPCASQFGCPSTHRVCFCRDLTVGLRKTKTSPPLLLSMHMWNEFISGLCCDKMFDFKNSCLNCWLELHKVSFANFWIVMEVKCQQSLKWFYIYIYLYLYLSAILCSFVRWQSQYWW